MQKDPHKRDEDRILAVSTGGFAVFCSLIFLFERLGLPAENMTWAIMTAITAFILLFALSRATLKPSSFQVGNEKLDCSDLAVSGSSDVISAFVILILISGLLPGMWTPITIIASLAIGLIAGSVLFTRRLCATGATSLPEYLLIASSSSTVRLVSAALVAIICIMLIYADLRLASVYLAPQLRVSTGSVIGFILVLSSLAALASGKSSVSRVQQALFLILLIMVLVPAIWISAKLTGLPVPQLLLDRMSEFTAGPLEGHNLQAEFKNALSGKDNFSVFLPVLLIPAYAVLPHLRNRWFSASPDKVTLRGNRWSIIISLIVLTSIPALGLVPVDPISAGGTVEGLEMPVILSVFVLMAVLIAAFSLSSILLVTIVNTLSHDGYAALFSGKKPPLRQVFLARLLIPLTAFVIWFCAVTFEFNGWLSVFCGLLLASGGLFPVIFVALWFKFPTPGGLLTGMISAMMMCVVVIYLADFDTVSSEAASWQGRISSPSALAVAILGIMMVNLGLTYIASLFTQRALAASK